MRTIILLTQLASFADETAAALQNGGVPTLVLKTFTDAATPIWQSIVIEARSENTGTAAPTATGRFSGRATAPVSGYVPPQTVPAATPPQKTVPTVQSAAKSAPAGTPAPVTAQNKTVVSIPDSKIETLRPPARRKMAGS